MSWDEWFRGRRRRYPFFDVGMDLFGLPFRLFGGDFEEFVKDWERMVGEFFKDLAVPEWMVRERRLSDGRTVKEKGPFIYGFSVKIGPDGRPDIKTFGDLKPKVPTRPWRPPVDLREEREPLIDVVEGDADVKIIAELPGVEKNYIKLHATESTLTISVHTPDRKYRKELDLPVEVEPMNGRSTYRNGVLEVTLPRRRERKPKGESIKIE